MPKPDFLRRIESFAAYFNKEEDGQHIIAIDSGGGFTVIERIDDPDWAEWICTVLNQALKDSN